MTDALALPDLLRQAGAVMTHRAGRPVPAHYGSAASELTVCVTRVGLAHRSDLGVLSIVASERGLEQLLQRVLRHGIAPRGAVLEAGAWWCRSESDAEVLVICPHDRIARLKAVLQQDIGRASSAIMTDVSGTRFILNVIGRRTGAVLADLGVYGDDRDPTSSSPFTELPVGQHSVAWLLEAANAALAVVDAGGAGDVWQAVEDAGRTHGLSCVGLESIDRYMVVERAKQRTATLL